MEIKVITGSQGFKHNIILLNFDDISLARLVEGKPLRGAIFMDDKEAEDWYRRKCAVVIAGKNLDIEKYKKAFKDDSFFKDGLTDKDYLKVSLSEIKRKIIDRVTQDLTKSLSEL